MSEQLLDSLEVTLGERCEAAVIWLHGLGADGYDFQPIVPELGLPADAGVRFVFPHAPHRPVTVNAGMTMRAWFDIRGIGAGFAEDADGIEASAAAVTALIGRERGRGIAPERLVLAGFSQGGAVALHGGLRYPERLAGIMGLSSWLPMAERLDAEAHAANRDTPVFLAHGSRDPVVPPELGVRTRDLLEERGYAVEWHDYPMEHQVCLEEVRHIGAWLGRVLGLTQAGG